jgi:hypothetical protein
MSTYLFEKIPGGARVQKDNYALHGVHPHECSIVDREENGLVTIHLRGISYLINVVVDTVTIDETAIGGATHTYGPATITSQDLQKAIMNVFNPYSNYITP